MPSFPPLYGPVIYEMVGEVFDGDGGTLIEGTTANTKGSYSELASATSRQLDGFYICLAGNFAGDFLIDIAIGAAASEVNIVTNLAFSGNNIRYGERLLIPISIPAGVRLSARIQASGANEDIWLMLLLATGTYLRSIASAGIATSYGANAADSGGVSVDPGGTIHTKGAYSEITSATTGLTKYLTMTFGSNDDFTRTEIVWHVDVAIGGAGSEVVLVPDIYVSSINSTDTIRPVWFSLPVTIPVGTRLAVRAECLINTAGDRLFDASMIGVG